MLTSSSFPFNELVNQLPSMMPQSMPKKEMPCFCKRRDHVRNSGWNKKAMSH